MPLLDRLKSGPVNEGFYKFYVKTDAFYVTEACTGCSFCVEACPLNNIQLNGGKPVWGKSCTHCMACICGWPTEAIEYGKRSKGKPCTSAQRMKTYENYYFTRQKDERGHGQPACPR